MTANLIWVHEPRKPNELYKLSALPGGIDLLADFTSFAKKIRDQSPQDLREPSTNKYARITDLKLGGRVLEMTVRSGNYGEMGALTDIHTDQETEDFDPGTATTFETHALLAVPEDKYAIFYVEQAASAHGASKILRLYEDEFRDRVKDSSLKRQAVVEGSAWLDSANLMKVRATSIGPADDVGNDKAVEHRQLGVVKHTLSGDRGGSLPRRVWDRLRGSTVYAKSLLGLSDDTDVKRLEVTVQGQIRGETRQKTFEVTGAGAPSFREILSDHNQAAPTASKFRQHALDVLKGHLETVDVKWSESDASGRWDDQDNPLIGDGDDEQQIERSTGSR